MWRRKVLKQKARFSVKINYWRMIAVCFLAAMLTTAYTSSTTFINQYNPETEVHADSEPAAIGGQSNSAVITDTVGQIADTKQEGVLLPAPVNTAVDLLIDTYTSGKSILFSILKTVNSVFTDHSYFSSLFLAAGAIFAVLFQIFIANPVLIGERRFFLEARKYHQTRISKIFFLYKLRYISNPAWIMFCRNVFQWLWNLTIAGGIIKYFEYSMIPFILAENPAISRKDAFHLSKQLMHGNKWKMFLLHFSFLGWQILSLLTFGVLDFIYVNPYITGTDAELYMELRRNYVLSRAAGYEAFNDPLLERVPSEDELLISKALYDDSEGPYTKISYFAPGQYPVFLYSIQPHEKAIKAPIQADKKYSFVSCVFLFFAFSIFGWILESVIHLVRDGVFLNRGYLFGPWIPLYGVCAVILLVFVKKFVHRPILSFTLIMAAYLVIEYLMNWLLEYEWDIVRTDYTGYFMNFNGRTFLGGAVFFAMLGCAFLYYLAPRWDDLFSRLPLFIRMALCIVLCVLFVSDLVYAALHPELLSRLLDPGMIFMNV